MKKTGLVVRKQRIHPFGASWLIAIPKLWFKSHGIDPEKTRELVVIADQDVRIVNPKYETEVHKDIHRLVERAPKQRRTRR